MILEKYPDWTSGQLDALLNMLGEETGRGLIAGELTVDLAGSTVVIKEAIKTFFDKHGRRIPPKGLVSAICDANRNFRLIQPEFVDWARRLVSLEQAGLSVAMSASDFASHVHGLMAKVAQGEQNKNLLNGIHLPILIPQTEVKDLGKTTEAFVGAVEKSYRQKFPRRSFTNYRKRELAEQVTLVEGSRYEQLLERLAKEAVVALYLPNPLQGSPSKTPSKNINSLER